MRTCMVLLGLSLIVTARSRATEMNRVADGSDAAANAEDQANPLGLRKTCGTLKEERVEAEETGANKQLLGIKLGVAFGAVRSSERAVTEAQLVNNIVRVSKSHAANVGVWLETHRLFRPGALFSECVGTSSGDAISKLKAAIGPFVAVQSSSEDVIDALAAGVMVGFRQPGSDKGSFNVGLGIALDPHFKTLGEGILANEPLPEGETEIRYKEKSKFRLLVLFSFVW